MISQFKNVLEYIHLFQPIGGKAKRSEWSSTVAKMFTNGYCYNFAKALYMTFKDKFNCSIVGTGILRVHTSDVEEWNGRIYMIKRALDRMEFAHFVCLMEDNQQNRVAFDINGEIDLENDDYVPIFCLFEKDKNRFKQSIEDSTIVEHFERIYGRDDRYGWKVIWKLNQNEIKIKDDQMKMIEEQYTYN